MMHKILEDGINTHGKAYAEGLERARSGVGCALILQALKDACILSEEARIELVA
jgi:hypothetical protein